jgi:hypothetical protein
MWRAEDGVGIVEADRAYVYRTGLTKESRKSWERVAHVHTAIAKDSHGIQECTMSSRTRDAKQQGPACASAQKPTVSPARKLVAAL